MNWKRIPIPARSIIILLLVITGSLAFSTWLMFHTFGYDSQEHIIRIDAKLWSDFGAAIPLIRSFSMGNNWPPQYPGFPGEPIRYHFGFYFLVGMLEKAGVRIDWALNIPSILGFSGLMISIYLLGRSLFRQAWVGILAIVFFLFNGSLGFIEYFKAHPIGPDTLDTILTGHRFTAFGPWDGGPVTAFWTLNIYTNQRHLAFSYAIAIFIILILLQKFKDTNIKQKILFSVLISFLTSILIVVNQAAAVIALVFMFWFFIIKKDVRLILAVAGIITIPWFSYISSITASDSNIVFQPGYLINQQLTLLNFLHFWFFNLGLHSILILTGMILAPKRIKILFIVPLLILFAAPNILRFSPDMINNHKFFNFFLIIGGLFSAYVIVQLFRIIKKIRFSRTFFRLPLYIFPVVILFFLTFTGIIDFLAIYNPEPGGIRDYVANPTAEWIKNNTPPDSVFLNSFWFYHPANLVGRYIYSGYSYFTWSYGYDKDKREQILKDIYNAPDTVTACDLLTKNHINYVELSDHHENYITVNWPLWRADFHPVYRFEPEGISIYDVKQICPATYL